VTENVTNNSEPNPPKRRPIIRTIFFLWFCCTLLFIVPALLLSFPVFWIQQKRNVPAAIRSVSYYFGRWTTRCAWPFLKIRKVGFDKLSRDKPCIFIANHHSFTDVFFCAHIPQPSIVVVVRKWPSRMPVLSLFIRAGRYVIAENTTKKEIRESGMRSKAAGYSMLFFPEGHRSRDGQLGRFGSGAFRVAAATGMPIVPIVIQGTRTLLPIRTILPHPAHVTLTALDPIDPARFDQSKRALRLRRHTENIYREFLGESYPESETLNFDQDLNDS
jgi:1-acyl-sn-glycerol-3-phosphate acyltransferase